METTNDAGKAPRPALSRRQLLRALAVGTAGGAVLATGGQPAVAAAAPPAGRPSALHARDVTLLTTSEAGSPFGPMPDQATQDADPSAKAYAEVLQTWLDANPGVTLEAISTNAWDQEVLLAAVAGGTAPALYPAPVLGGWNLATSRSAFAQGLAADITPLVERFEVRQRINPVAAKLWDRWRIDDKTFSVPGDILFSGTGMFYRIDLLRAAGLEEPPPGWTWVDVRRMAKALTTPEVKGVALPLWAVGLRLNSEAFDLLTQIPAPDEAWHWRYDFSSRADRWTALLEDFRGMVFEDQTVSSDITYDMPQNMEAFIGGTAAMAPLNSATMGVSPGLEGTSITEMPKRYGKQMDELVGFVALPVGETGVFGGSQPSITPVAFNPDLDAAALEKAVDLYTHFWYRDGYTAWKQATWRIGQDPTQVYHTNSPVNGLTQIEGVPVSVDDVWPAKFLAGARAMDQIPLVPDPGEFLPAEENAGPTRTAWQDAESRWSFEPGELDLRADLADVEGSLNAEVAGLASSVSRDEFVAAAREYYAAHDAFWAQHAPAFHEQTYRPWYDEKVAPILG